MKNLTTYLKVGGSCKFENKIYFLNKLFNALFYLDIVDLSIHFVHDFSKVAPGMIRVPGVSMIYENAIYVFPSCANFILKYDLLRREEKIINISGYDGQCFYTIGIIQQQNKVYMFPSELGKGIFVLDLYKQEIEQDKELSALFASGFSCGTTFIVHDNCVLLSQFGSNVILEVNIETKKIVYTEIIDKNLRILSMHFDGANYWILQVHSPEIYEWNREKNSMQIYTSENIVWDEEQLAPYSNIIFLKKQILIVANYLTSILQINSETKKIEFFRIFPKEFALVDNRFRNGPMCYQYTMLEDKVIIYSDSGNMLLVYDILTEQLSGRTLMISEKEAFCLKDILTREIFRGGVDVKEDDNINLLSNFMCVIEQNACKKMSNNSKNMGALIYGECIK